MRQVYRTKNPGTIPNAHNEGYTDDTGWTTFNSETIMGDVDVRGSGGFREAVIQEALNKMVMVKGLARTPGETY